MDTSSTILHDKRQVLDAPRPQIAVSFSDSVTVEAITDANRRGMDVAELRIDLFDDVTVDHVVEVARRFEHVPTIATIRRADEGGNWSGTDDERAACFRAVMPHVNLIDIEAASSELATTLIREARDTNCGVIVSSHDFERTRSVTELIGQVDRSASLGADLVKVATMVNSSDDLRTLAHLLAVDHDVPLIVIGMGPRGSSSRVFGPYLGSLLSFAAYDRASAPGQLPLDDLAAIFGQLDVDDEAAGSHR